MDNWRLTSNYAIWMSLTDPDLFDIVDARHPCAGASTLSLEDVRLRVAQNLQDLKLDEKMVASKEAISRTWITSSSKVRGAVGSAWANLDQYRAKKPDTSSTPVTPTTTGPVEKGDTDGQTNGKEEKEGKTFVGSWSAWASERRKKVFQKEEVARPVPMDIGPAPARPLAQWAKRASDASSTLASPRMESVRSSSERSALAEKTDDKTDVSDKTFVEEETKDSGNAEMEVKL